MRQWPRMRVLYSFPDRLGSPGIGMTAFHQVTGASPRAPASASTARPSSEIYPLLIVWSRRFVSLADGSHIVRSASRAAIGTTTVVWRQRSSVTGTRSMSCTLAESDPCDCRGGSVAWGGGGTRSTQHPHPSRVRGRGSGTRAHRPPLGRRQLACFRRRHSRHGGSRVRGCRLSPRTLAVRVRHFPHLGHPRRGAVAAAIRVRPEVTSLRSTTGLASKAR